MPPVISLSKSMFISADNLVSLFSARASGNMSLSYGDTKDSLSNRRNFLSGSGIPYQDLVCAKQVHGSNIRYVAQEDKGKGALDYAGALDDTDALVTDKKNLPLAIFTADCLSLFLYDPKTPAIGLVHAGWRSSKEGITAKTISFMQEQFNTDPSLLRVNFGPAIRGCCYEVSADFRDLFPAGLRQRGARYYLDLMEVNKAQAQSTGVREENIVDSGTCTLCRRAEFFSFRREGKSCGRMISVMMLKS